ncbi:MAG: amino acid permease [Elusimicrobiales bacterium]|nr:amino acid permease [Elusimicrobiales bacterium]
MSIFRVKPVDMILSEAQEGNCLKRALGAFDVTMIGIGAIIGAGIFATVGAAVVGSASGHPAGPSLIISFALTAVACGFTALCYAEFAAMVPVSGSAYTYAYATLGELIAWIIGWDLIIEYAIGNVAVAISWAGYFNDFLSSFFGVSVPVWLRTDYRTFSQSGLDFTSVPHIFGVPVIINIFGLLIVAAITVLLLRGIKESSRFNDVMVGIKLLVLAIFVGVGFYYFDPKNWVPFAPGGFRGIQVGAATIFFAYIGFDAVSTVAEETRDPKRDMPIGILGSLVICTVVYILVTAALTGMMPFMEIKSKIAEPLVAGLEYHHASRWLIALVSLGAVVANTAVLLVFQMGQPRIFFSMSRDGLLPPVFAKVHPVYRTPWVTTIWTGVVVGVMAMFCNIDEMVNLCNIGTLFAFVLVCAGIIVLRIKDPARPRPFRAPGGYATPVLGILFCLGLMHGLGRTNWIRFGVWLLIGLVIYYFYSRHHSELETGKKVSCNGG